MQILPDKYKSFQQSELEVKWSRWKSWSWAASQGCLSQGTVCLTCQAQQGSLWVIVDLERKPVLPSQVICRCLISSCSCRTLGALFKYFFFEMSRKTSCKLVTYFYFFFNFRNTAFSTSPFAESGACCRHHVVIPFINITECLLWRSFPFFFTISHYQLLQCWLPLLVRNPF